RAPFPYTTLFRSDVFREVRAGEEGGALLLPGAVDLEQRRADDRGDQDQERENHRPPAREPDEQRESDRRRRPRKTRKDGEALEDPDQDGVPDGRGRAVLAPLAREDGEKQEKPGQDFHRSNESRVRLGLLGDLLQEEADDPGRDGRRDDENGELPGTASLRRLAGEESGGVLGERLAEIHDDRHERSEVDHHVEENSDLRETGQQHLGGRK